MQQYVTGEGATRRACNAFKFRLIYRLFANYSCWKEYVYRQEVTWRTYGAALFRYTCRLTFGLRTSKSPSG